MNGNEIERLRAADPVPVPPTGAPPFAVVMTEVRAGTEDRPRDVVRARSRRHRRAAGIGGLAVVLAATTAAGVAATRWLPADTADVSCVFDLTSVGVLDSVTGDPVADCGQAWRDQTGTEPPPMVAYDTGQGIEVRLADLPAPEGGTALPAGVVQDPALIELQSALPDYVDGLQSRCFGAPEAIAFGEQTLARLGLVGWKVTADDRSDGKGCFVDGFGDPVAKTLQVVALEGSDGGVAFGADGLATQVPGSGPSRTVDSGEGTPWEGLPGVVRDAVGTCRTLTEAQAAIGTVDPQVVAIRAVPDPAADCTRADLTVGGRVDVVLRGPAG